MSCMFVNNAIDSSDDIMRKNIYGFQKVVSLYMMTWYKLCIIASTSQKVQC